MEINLEYKLPPALAGGSDKKKCKGFSQNQPYIILAKANPVLFILYPQAKACGN